MSHSTSVEPYMPSQLDRIASSVYFLGAVGPLVALAYVVHQYVLPNLSGVFATGLMGLVASVAILTLGSFFVLRRATRASLERMGRDNHQLARQVKITVRLESANGTPTSAKACAPSQALRPTTCAGSRAGSGSATDVLPRPLPRRG